MVKFVLIADAQWFSGGVGELAYELKAFGDAGIELTLGSCLTEDDVIRQGQTANAILLVEPHMLLSERTFTSLPDCRVVLKYGVGVDAIDVAAATRHGVMVLIVPHCAEEVATCAATLILSLCRKTILLDQQVRKGEWNAFTGYPLRRLSNLTLGFFGMGRIGRYLAGIFRRGWHMPVIVHDPFLAREEARQLEVTPVSFADLLRQSDIISIHAPLTDATYHVFGEKEFQKMKPTVIIVNTARGAIIHEQSLVKALQERRVLAAGLDVYEQEPLPKDSPLLQLDNVILSPHVAYYTEESLQELHRIATDTVIQALNGQIPFNVFNTEVIPKIG